MSEKSRGAVRLRRELNFITIISIVIGSQIGAGAFMTPALLSPFKTIGILGLVIAAIGAISLALVFSDLASHLPKNGGPHVYVSVAFGRVLGFFTAWSYWIISWFSNAVLLSIIVGYLTIMTGSLTSFQIILIESSIVLLITYINIDGVKFSGLAQLILTILKIIPFLVLPVIFFVFFNCSNFDFSFEKISLNSDSVPAISKAILISFFGFLGVECATASAESVKNPKKTIPRAIILGTMCVAMIYIMNTTSMVGVVGFDSLSSSNAPYATVLGKIFSNSSNIAISIMAIIVCIGTLNAWTLTSGQIAYGAFEDGLFPKVFGKLNKAGAPVVSLLLAAVGMIICFIIMGQSDSIKDSLIKLVDISSSIFLYIYLICCGAYIKLISKWKPSKAGKIKAYTLALFSSTFCLIILTQDMLAPLLVLGVIIILGVPVFLKHKKSIKI